MAGYDARRVAAWAKKQTGESLVPAPRVSKTRAEQRREAAEKELDKYDLNKQPDGMEKNPGNGLYSPLAVTQSSSATAYNFVYNIVAPRTLQFFRYLPALGTDDDKAREEYLKAEEEAKRKRHDDFKSRIDVVGQASVVSEPSKPSWDFKIPDIVGTLTAWRGWSVRNGKLTALGRSERWTPKMAVPAQCLPFFGVGHEDDAPSHDCSCGYWSFKTLDLLKEALEPYMDSVTVIGQIDVWGKVIDCKNGYRSEFAYPKELWLLKPGLESLGVTYGVPIRK